MSVRYYPLINKVITSLRLADRSVDAKWQQKKITENLFPRPFITIAREPGSGGKPIAKAVAKKLGFTFVDKQIINELASSTKKSSAVIKNIDEKSRSQVTDLIHNLFNVDYVDDLKYVTQMAKVLIAYAMKGHVVILGRGGNFITPMGTGLHVRITAPYDVRVQRAMEYEGYTKAQAKEVIAEVTRDRQAFIKQYLRHDSKKANSYDLTINTTHFTVDQVATIIVEVFCQKFSKFDRYKALISESLHR